MIKRTISVIITVCMMIAMMPVGEVFAGTTNTVIDYTYDGTTIMYSYTIDSNGDKVATVISKADGEYSGDITIPGEIKIGDDTYTVTGIGDSAFSECTGLTSITIPAGVTSITTGAFARCSSLGAINVALNNDTFSSVDGVLFDKAKTTLIACPVGKTGDYTIPDGVARIGTSAFAGCRGITSITIPDGVTRIGPLAFSDCAGLTSITLPNSVTSIEGAAFKSCTSLTSITIPDSVTSIGSWAFAGCTSLTKITTLASVISIGTDLFAYCNTIKTVTYDRIRHTVAITPADNYIVKEISISGSPVSVTDGAMVLENIYDWSKISVTLEPKPEPAFEPDKYVGKLKFKANSSKTSKGNIRIKVNSVTDDNGNKIDLTELKDKGYTVKFKYYSSTKKASKYTAKVEKDADINSYINTSGKKGTRYYYKVRVMVYDSDGNLVAKSDLKQCSYAARTWSK